MFGMHIALGSANSHKGPDVKNPLTEFAIAHPKWVVTLSILITLGFLAQFPRIQIDTDPENMLPANEPTRVFHHELKDTFNLNDFLVLGIVRDGGMFHPEPLAHVAAITSEILDLDGVVADDVMAPTEVDDITIEDGGILRVAPLMGDPPQDEAGAERILERIKASAILRGKLASDDGTTIALFIPIEDKNRSYEIGQEITEIVHRHQGDEKYYLAGLPMAEDTFGSAMFKQMAISAPLAMVILFLLMLYFFRNLRLVLTAMALAMMSVIWGMGALIGSGNTVHIMSSMIPIFLIPIAILPSIHILTEMIDHRARAVTVGDAVRSAMGHLFKPVLFTTITTVVGFASLMMTPIPPVQVFGAFVAFGIVGAWLLSMTFLPAMVMLETHRGTEVVHEHDAEYGALAHYLQKVRATAIKGRWIITLASVLIFALSIYGLTKVQVNDNPVRWFKAGHPLRVADRVMNKHLAGTYLGYVELKSDEDDRMKDPAVMRWIEGFQHHLDQHENVGATTSVADVVKKVNFELAFEDSSKLMIPDDQNAVAQSLFLYEMSGGSPDDLYHFITPSANAANIWVQMRAGENSEVSSVVKYADEYLASHPLPEGITMGWGGLAYVNIVWQEKMVAGMAKALFGSFVVVFFMMTFLFRSFIWGVVSMLPLTGTIALIYGMLGFTGKYYDMPVAVLSSLTLGLSIDFAIHFIQRSREYHKTTQDYQETMRMTFDSTGRAIFRNVMVLAIGFVPMFFATLTPYFTVGLFFFLIMTISGAVTMLLLPAITALRPQMFYPNKLAGGGRGLTMLAVGLTTLAVAASVGVPGARAQETDATKIMEKSHLAYYYAGDDGRSQVKMTLVDRKGKERLREFTMLRLDVKEGGEQRYYTYFTKPADVRRTTFMVIKHVPGDDDRWIYIPALDLVRRLSANDKNSSFVGSDFTYEDVSGRHWTDDNHTLVREDELDGHKVWVIDSMPKDESNWAKKTSYIDQATYLPLKEEYYDDKGTAIREFTADKIEEIQGIPTITVRTMKNLEKNQHTTVEFMKIEYNIGIPEDIFQERYLKNPPREYLD